MHPSLSAVIFDLDGTLVDSNHQQVDAWLAALKDRGYGIGRDRVNRAVGMGGDQLVADLLGEEIDRRDGDALRRLQVEHATAMFQRGVKVFPSAVEAVKACRERGLKTALATSSAKDVQALLLSKAGINPELFDVRISGDEVDASKPQPDMLRVAIEQLGVSPAEVVNVGDTPWDCIAGRRAGLVTIGLGHDINDERVLRESGARVVAADVDTFCHRLDALLAAASPRSVRLTARRMGELMTAALEAAEAGMAAGEAPIGSVVAAGDGRVIATGYNRLNATQDCIAHAEIVALHAAAGKVHVSAKDLIVVATLEPCVMCLGATMEAGIDTVLYGLPAPADGGARRITPPTSPESQMPRIVGGILAERSRALFEKWLGTDPNPQQAKFVKQLLQMT